MVLTKDELQEIVEDLKDYLKDLKNVTNAKEIKEGSFEVEFVE